MGPAGILATRLTSSFLILHGNPTVSQTDGRTGRRTRGDGDCGCKILMGDLEEGEGERETARKIGRVTCHGALNEKGITACSYGHFVAGLGIGPSREAHMTNLMIMHIYHMAEPRLAAS